MANKALLAHDASQFRKSFIELAPGVWTAVGFAASNMHVLEGETSLTIIDTTESTGAAENVLTEIRKRSDKPIGRVIYTHSHRDHICGATVFTGGRGIPVLASSTFQSDLIGVDHSIIRPNKALARRTLAQFGFGLTGDQRVSLGCGPGNRPLDGLGAGFVPPNTLIDRDQDVDLDGVSAQLIMAPGETADHMVVWLPEQKVLFCGDNWYHAFPNLYAIRGTPYRDFSAWANSLRALGALQAEILAPGHTMPVSGKDAVNKVLETTREAIEFVIQFTANAMDAGKPLDDIVAEIALPEHLADLPWLGEFYGRLGWSARAYAVGSLGWYDGNPTHLGTLSSYCRARHMAELAGGPEALMRAAREADDLQWRLELCDHLLALGQAAQGMKADVLERLAEDEINATARNTYLWEALRLREEQASHDR